MQKLAWVLGLVALCSSVFLCISGFVARRGVQHATAAVQKAQGDLADWQASANLETMNHNTAVENDELQLRNDDLDIQIAELKDESATKLLANRSADQMQLTVDKNVVDLDELNSALGPDPNVSSAMERVDAARRSLSVYSAVLARDEHLAYATGGVWLAFGFAIALAARERKLPRTENAVAGPTSHS